MGKQNELKDAVPIFEIPSSPGRMQVFPQSTLLVTAPTTIIPGRKF
jgi:hypothetical protein